MKRFLLPVLIAGVVLLGMQQAQAFDPEDLKKLKKTNSCKICNLEGANLSNTYLSGAVLSGADLRDADLRKANLFEVDLTTAKIRYIKLEGAKFCKSKTPWGEVNDDCEE